MSLSSHSVVGIVVIGRNEGKRLNACLRSLRNKEVPTVYVDSGSTDKSVTRAKSWGADIVCLDAAIPFTAARARNEGFRHLLTRYQQLQFVQFIDGDCAMHANWLEIAIEQLYSHSQTAVVCGRRREIDGQTSIYNHLCDMEWNTPVGEARECGGDAMMRIRAFEEVKGYDASLIAGEEPELCLRLRRKGWGILRVDADMTFHDAAITHFYQWWKRTERAGCAYAGTVWIHGKNSKNTGIQPLASIAFWGVLLPVVGITFVFQQPGWIFLGAGVYGFQAWRIHKFQRQRGYGMKDAWIYAGFTLLGKFAQAWSVFHYFINKVKGLRVSIIEYKEPQQPASL